MSSSSSPSSSGSPGSCGSTCDDNDILTTYGTNTGQYNEYGYRIIPRHYSPPRNRTCAPPPYSEQDVRVAYENPPFRPPAYTEPEDEGACAMPVWPTGRAGSRRGSRRGAGAGTMRAMPRMNLYQRDLADENEVWYDREIREFRRTQEADEQGILNQRDTWELNRMLGIQRRNEVGEIIDDPVYDGPEYENELPPPYADNDQLPPYYGTDV